MMNFRVQAMNQTYVIASQNLSKIFVSLSQEGRSLIITVSDPKKESEGINSYISYKVNTQTNLPEFNYGQCVFF